MENEVEGGRHLDLGPLGCCQMQVLDSLSIWSDTILGGLFDYGGCWHNGEEVI